VAVKVVHTTVRANGTTFDVATAGRRDAPPVLALHGFPEGWMTWRPVMEALGGARLYAPDLRGYGATHARGGYDVFTLTDDIRGLIEELDLHRPLLVGHDWGGALAWIFAHRHSSLIGGLVAVNCPHPRTLVRAVFTFDDFQTLRIPWVPIFQVPLVPELVLTTPPGRAALKLSFTLREGTPGTMDVSLVDELVARFRAPGDMGGPINYYREMVRTLLLPWRRAKLERVYEKPITVPITLVWGERDGALSAKVARSSDRDAGRAVEWRPLAGVGHFVSLEAPELLASEIERALGAAGKPAGGGRPVAGVTERGSS
jgi:pimeloyl-ACP methyl ester carboxylesterase